MAITVDTSTVALVNLERVSTANPCVGTSASFTAPADSLLVVCLICNADTGISPALTMSNNGAALTWTIPVQRNDTDGDEPFVAIARAVVASERTGLTVTASVSDPGQNAETINGIFKVYIVTGHNTGSPDGNVAEGSAATGTVNGSVTVAGAGRLFGAGMDWNAGGSPASTDTEETYHDAAVATGLVAVKAADHASGSQSINFQVAGTPKWNWVVYEVAAAAGGTTLTPAPPSSRFQRGRRSSRKRRAS